MTDTATDSSFRNAISEIIASCTPSERETLLAALEIADRHARGES